MESYYNCHLKYLIHKRNWKLGHFLLKLQCNPNNSPLSYSYHGQPCLIHVWIEINWSWVWVKLGGCSHFFGQSSLPCEMKMHEEHFITHRQCVSIGWAFPINNLNCLKNNKARKKTWCILKDRPKIKTVKNICTIMCAIIQTSTYIVHFLQKFKKKYVLKQNHFIIVLSPLCTFRLSTQIAR